jgi:hypothetical protein
MGVAVDGVRSSSILRRTDNSMVSNEVSTSLRSVRISLSWYESSPNTLMLILASVIILSKIMNASKTCLLMKGRLPSSLSKNAICFSTKTAKVSLDWLENPESGYASTNARWSMRESSHKDFIRANSVSNCARHTVASCWNKCLTLSPIVARALRSSFCARLRALASRYAGIHPRTNQPTPNVRTACEPPIMICKVALSMMRVLQSPTIKVGTPDVRRPLADPGVRNYRTGLLGGRAHGTSAGTKCLKRIHLASRYQLNRMRTLSRVMCSAMIHPSRRGA